MGVGCSGLAATVVAGLAFLELHWVRWNWFSPLSWNLCRFCNKPKFWNVIPVLLCRWGLWNTTPVAGPAFIWANCNPFWSCIVVEISMILGLPEIFVLCWHIMKFGIYMWTGRACVNFFWNPKSGLAIALVSLGPLLWTMYILVFFYCGGRSMVEYNEEAGS